MEKKPSKLLTSRKSDKFTDRQERFIEKMADPSIKSKAEAAREAGYSPNGAKQAAAILLTNIDLCEAIEKRKADLAERADVKAEAILGGAATQAFASIDDALDEEGHFDINKARETGVIHLIKSMSRTPTKFGESVRFEMYSAEAGRQELADYMGLKQKPRENQDRLKRLAVLVKQYMVDYPDAELFPVQQFFARGAGVPVEEIIQAMENIQ